MASPVAVNNDHLPSINQKSTIQGVTITFMIIPAIAVVLRMYARMRTQGFGWDDLFVVLALCSSLVGGIAVCICTYHSLGLHFATLDAEQIKNFFHTFYIANASYPLSTALIKVSLLFQFLRLWRSGLERRISQGLLIFTVFWGLAYSFIVWFPCFPPHLYWSDWTHMNIAAHNANCYGFGTLDRIPFVATYESHSAINMALDLVIFLLPAGPLVRKQAMSNQQRLGILGLLVLGLTVIIIAIVRLVNIVQHQVGWRPTQDWTYYAPVVVVCSILEVSVAILAASIPVFWPVLEASFDMIFVTHEVHVEAHRQNSVGVDMELESGSINSRHSSQIGLNRSASPGDSWKDNFLYGANSSKSHTVAVEAKPYSASSNAWPV